MDNFIITGSSSGIGKFISKQLSKKENVIGISRSKPANETQEFKNLIFDFKNEITNEKIESLTNLLKNKKFTLIINAADNFSDFRNGSIDFNKSLELLKVNYINQIMFFLKLAETKNLSIEKLLFISSYDVFSGKISSSFGYVLSKSLLFETAKILNRYFKQVKITPKIVILGGVDTKMYNNNKIEHEAKNHETLLKPELVASKIIEFIYNKKEILFLPKKNKYLAMFRYIVEFFKFTN